MNKINKIITWLFIVMIIALLSSLCIGLLPATKAHACGTGWFESPCDSNAQQLNVVKENQRKMVNSTPVPQLQNSLERKNVAKRAELFDKPDKLSYIYLVSYGKVMAFYTVKGKVSSLQSYLTPQEQIVDEDGTECWNGDSTCFLTLAPDIDGTYGDNVAGIFFFTTEGAYVEWNGEYMMSDQPLQLTATPELVRQIK